MAPLSRSVGGVAPTQQATRRQFLSPMLLLRYLDDGRHVCITELPERAVVGLDLNAEQRRAHHHESPTDWFPKPGEA